MISALQLAKQGPKKLKRAPNWADLKSERQGFTSKTKFDSLNEQDPRIQGLISSFNFKFLFQDSISGFNFKFQFQVSISSLNFKFQFQVSISSFNFKFQCQASTSSFNYKFHMQVSIPSLNFKFQFQISSFKFQVLILIRFMFKFLFKSKFLGFVEAPVGVFLTFQTL